MPALLIIILVVELIVVSIHFSALRLLPRRKPLFKGRPQWNIFLTLFYLLIVHIFEICIYALGYYILIPMERFGTIAGEFTYSFLDCEYFSFAVYTSLGFGDLVPIGRIRLLATVETITGLIMIAWSASFLYIQMQKFWDETPKNIDS